MVFTPGFLLRTDAGANLELFEGETMRPKLTTQQQEVLDSINRHARQNGTPPLSDRSAGPSECRRPTPCGNTCGRLSRKDTCNAPLT